jgi:hypothetical protein
MLYFRHADVAQWIECVPPEHEVVGSSPAVSVTSRNPLPNAPLSYTGFSLVSL